MAQPLRIKTDTDERIYNTEAYFMASPIIWTPSQTLIPIDGSYAGKRKVGNNVDTYADLDFENSGAVGSYSPPIPQSDVTDLESDLSDIVAQAARDRHPVVTFSTNTNTAQDPGQATIRFNNGTIASVTEIALSDADSEGIDKGDLNSRCAGIIQLRTVASAATIEFLITAVVHTSWTRYTVTYLKGSLPSNGTVLAVRFLPVNVVTQTITNGATTTAPSEDAVFDALALKADLLMPPTIITGNTAYSAGDRFLLNVNTGSHPEYTLPASPTNGLVLKFGCNNGVDMFVLGNGKTLYQDGENGSTATISAQSAIEIVFSTSADIWLVTSKQGTVSIT